MTHTERTRTAAAITIDGTYSFTYMRRSDDSRQLPPEAMRELEAYLAQLRAYYDIPDDQPVFPKRPRRSGRRAKPSRKAKNRLNHPWRGAL
jgi:hypothetical protein